MSDAPLQPIDLSRVRTFPVARRSHKVDAGRLAGVPDAGARFGDWLASLPDFLGVTELRAAVEAVVAARRADRPVVMALGAHVVKVGCSPVVIDLMRRGVVTALALNGATAIHDVELALFGETSEEVADTIRDGRFGMVRETPEFFAAALAAGRARGLGAALGAALRSQSAPHGELSLLRTAAELSLPATVHVALGTDTIHMHPQVDPGALGEASGVDFRLACAVVAGLGAGDAGGAGGVWCNVGSAALLPEVFLKAVSVARNLGHNLDAMHTLNLDMQRHYRPQQNVIGRPVAPGHGHELIGQHEILLPLLRQAVVESLAAR
ncbi:MAG: hypothetical protein U1A27_08420 [Phycisphaerae bacterium]